MNVLVLGVSGFIGTHVAQALRARGDGVITASLRDPDAAARAASDADVVVNLAGEPIGQRWSARVKERIASSRIDAPRAFLDALARGGHFPRAYVSASAIGYYGTSESATFTEESPPGDDFLARVCVGWEREATRTADFGMRVAVIRSGIVLGREGGAFASMLPAFRAGTGGVVGSGRQWMSWIHSDDVVRIYLRAIDGASGVHNATAPTPVTNAEFTKILGTVLHRPTLLKVPTFALRALLAEGAQIITSGQRVLPKRLSDEGYAFAYPSLEPALQTLLSTR